jgi:hypothetical protein
VSWANDPSNVVRVMDVSDHLSRWVSGNVPQVVFLAGAAVLAGARRTLRPEAVSIISVALATMPLFWASAHVQQNTHFSTLWILSTMLGSLAWAHGGLRPTARAVVAALFAVATGAALVHPARAAGEAAYFWQGHARLSLTAVAGIRVPRWQQEVYEPVVSFIREHVPEREAIYSGLMRHDAVVISDQRFYFLSGRPVASRYNELHPGIVDLEPAQHEIIADLERLEVRCAVLWDFGWPTDQLDGILAERRRAIPAIGSRVLDEYLRKEFQEIGRYGEYVLVWRKGGVMPQAPVLFNGGKDQ